MKNTYKQALNEVKQACQQQIDEVKQVSQQQIDGMKRVCQQQMDGVKQACQQQIDGVRQANQWQQQELNKLKQTHQHQKDEIKQTQRELDEIKKRNDLLERACEDVQKKQVALDEKFVSLQTHTSPLSLPPFYFIMSNVGHYKQHNCVFWSEPFYSHPGGYKMAIKIYPNGRGYRKGTHLSLYVDIIRGEFDDKLRWPFDGEVTVQAYNRTTEQWSMKKIFALNEKCCGLVYVCRQVDTITIADWGYVDYLPLSEFKKDYVKDTDVVRFRITDVKVCT